MSVLEQIHNLLKDKYPNITIDLLERVEKAFRAYGYLNGGVINKDDFEAATKQFQEYAGIEVDGELGIKTIKALSAPRCGCRDVEYLKEDASNPPRWGIKNIKWYIQDYLTEFSKDEYAAIIKHGFDYTSKYIDLEFEQVKNSNQANLVFTSSNNPRDDAGTPGQVLAWAELPSKANFTGQLVICMDEAEDWRGPNDMKRGIKVLNVLNHESCAGHSLGLSHSKIQTALLAPIYNVNVVYPQENDDLSRLRTLYGRAEEQKPEQPKPEPPKPEDFTTIKIYGKVDKIEMPGYRVQRIG